MEPAPWPNTLHQEVSSFFEYDGGYLQARGEWGFPERETRYSWGLQGVLCGFRWWWGLSGGPDERAGRGWAGNAEQKGQLGRQQDQAWGLAAAASLGILGDFSWSPILGDFYSGPTDESWDGKHLGALGAGGSSSQFRPKESGSRALIKCTPVLLYAGYRSIYLYLLWVLLL